MKLKNIPVEELEIMSYTDIAYHILKENKKSINTPGIFRELCDLLNYTDEEYKDKIGDFYTSLTTDKRFVLLENNEWDIRERHSVEIVIDDDEEEIEDVEVEEIEDEEEIEEDIDAPIDDDDLEDDEDIDDDLEDLTLVDEEEIDSVD